MKSFFLLLRKKTSFAISTFASSIQRKYGWAVETSTLLTCRTARFRRFESFCFRYWWGSSIGQSSCLRSSRLWVRVPPSSLMEVWQSWSIALVLKTSRRKRLKGSNPLASAIKELWQTWCMRKTENLENVVRLHEVPLNDTIPYGIAKWSL